MAIDIEGLKRSISLEVLVERMTGESLKADGNEFKGLCPIHGENTPSFTVTPDIGRFYCFGCGRHGDHIDFIQEYSGLDFKAACDELAQIANVTDYQATGRQQPEPPKRKPRPEDLWKPVTPGENWQTGPGKTVPALYPKKIDEDGRPKVRAIKFESAYPYYNTDGTLAGVILRSSTASGKLFQTLTYRAHVETGETRWVVMALPEPRPLYGLPDLMANPSAQVVLVEGEKTRDAAQALIGNGKIVVVSWAGGSKAINKTDWSPLAGRKVAAWPDCDSKEDKRNGGMLPYHQQPGMAAMLAISKSVPDDTAFRIVRVPEPGEWPDGWDLADAQDWGKPEVIKYIKENATNPANIIPEPVPITTPPEPEYDPDDAIPPADYMPADADQGPAPEPSRFDDQPFQILGWDDGAGFYLPRGFRQVVRIPASSHTRLQLLTLAPLGWWSEAFPDEKHRPGRADWDMAADSLIRQAQAKGVFDRKKVRGRGAWFDAGRSVVHGGDRLVVDGEETDLESIDSEYIYPMAKPMKVSTAEPLHNSRDLINICDMVRWEDPIAGRLLAGWCFLAPICGAIDWRPHLWLSGPAGSGKSTVMYRIMKPVLADMCIHAAGDTTEAGLRQRLKQDALPVMFDEFEREREKAAKRAEDVLALVRQSSSDTGAEIIKGGANGSDDSYLIRSMFAFASINVSMSGMADESRITVLSMKGSSEYERQTPEMIAHWQQLSEMIRTTLTPDYIRKLQARAITMIPTIRENIRVFSDAVAESPALGGKRLGDQVGTLLAGAYSLCRREPITLDGALKWLGEQNWSGVNNGSAVSDERACLGRILQHIIRVEGTASAVSMTIAELIDIVSGYDIGNENINHLIADKALQRYGIRCCGGGTDWEVRISTGHKELERVLAGHGYDGWGRILSRLPGYHRAPTTRFAGAVSGAISLPLEVVRGDDEGD